MKNKKRRISCLLLFSLLILNFLGLCKSYSQEEEGAAKEREEWFFGQRKHPYDSIPVYGYKNAIQQRDALRSQGYFLEPVEWNHIGPQPFLPIIQIQVGPASGRVAAIKYAPPLWDPSGNTIYIAGAQGGVWKTTDGGLNWSNLTDYVLPTQVSGALAIDETRGIIYYGTGDNTIYGQPYMGLGVFKSTDYGQSWIQISSGLPEQTKIFRISINPNNPDNIFVAEWTGLYKTLNGGATWTRVIPISDMNRFCSDVAFSPNGSKVYAIGSAPDYFAPPYSGIGYWRSSDGGNTFEQIGPGSGFPHVTTPTYGRSVLAVSQGSEETVYILSHLDDPYPYNKPAYIYKSENGGSNFSLMNGGISVEHMQSQAGYDMMLQCSPVTSDICFFGGINFRRTTDGGNVWDYKRGTPWIDLIHVDFHNMDFNPVNPDMIIAGNDGGVFHSSNLGDNWVSLNEKLSLTQIYRVASNTYNPNVIVIGIQDEGIGYKDPGVSQTFWRTAGNANDCDGGLVLASPFKPNVFVGGRAACRTLHYSNDGINFPFAEDYMVYQTSSSWIAPTVAHPSQPGIFYTMRCSQTGPFYSPFYVFKSTNDGASWGGNPFSSFTNGDENRIPQTMAISASNPDIMFFANGNPSDFWHRPNKLYRSSNEGQTWTAVVTGGSANLPDRYFTHIEVEPSNENEVYLTVSGFHTGHIFKSTDGGFTWTDISGNLPDNPVSDLIIRYTSSDSKELIAATDVGVYRSDAVNISWRELALGLPTSPVTDLDYNRLSGMLRASAFGRGIWEVELEGPIYVKDNLFITSTVTIDKDIVVCNGGKLSLGHPDLSNAFTLKMKENTKIIVENGGQIETSNSQIVTFTSQSGLWGGIEFQGLSHGNLTNITFENTETPITVNGSASETPTSITISGCTFKNGPVVLNNRRNITVSNCNWSYTTPASVPSVFGVSAVGCENLYIMSNVMNYNSSLDPSGAIFVDYCNNAVIQYNNINEAWNGIGFYNSSGFISTNNITTTTASHAMTAIGMTNVYSTTVEYNTIRGFQKAFYMNNSSPSMLGNDAVNTYSYGSIYTNSGLEAEYNSSPLLAPAGTGGLTIIDAGQNTLSQNTLGCGIIMKEQSIPVLDQGNNIIYGYNYYLSGYVGYPVQVYDVTYNCWVDEPPVQGKFDVADIQEINYAPWNTCNFPGGGGGEKEPEKALALAAEPYDPPQYIIVSYGNVYDTIQLTTQSMNLSADRQMFSYGVKQMLEGQYQNAITTFKQVVQQYQDSLTAINSLKKIMYCHFRMHADTSAFSSLRSYYLNLVSQNQSDTSFVQVATELATKTLVRRTLITNAIEEFEYVATNSTDSAEVDNAELNIIQTYLLLSGGDANYTGSLTQLKPANLFDAIRMINKRLYHFENVPKTKVIPDKFHLSQNYPNPFNASTKINYALPQSAKVTIKVYDILGRLVKFVVNEFKEAGFHSVTFDAKGLASGVYFYRIKSGDFVDSKKMVVLK